MIEKKKRVKKKRPYRKSIQLIWAIFILGILGIFFLFGGAALGWYGPMPDLQQLENTKSEKVSPHG